MNPLWTDHYNITSLLVNPLGRLGLYGTLNLLQETAWRHAETLGFGMKDMEQQGLYWVLTRQHLKMSDWPAFNSKVSVETWLRPPLGAFANREFAVRSEDGTEIGRCTTSWLALDRESRRILPVGGLRSWKDICLERSNDMTADKIPVEGTYEGLSQFRVRNSDLDINQHVNNTKYSQWILDAIPYELHKKVKLRSYAVNFLGETHLEDEVRIDRGLKATSSLDAAEGNAEFRGVRASDEKMLFTARLGWESSPEL
jgi:medium-chain acyl-[acyl-carrier-protein] hydrolase